MYITACCVCVCVCVVGHGPLQASRMELKDEENVPEQSWETKGELL